jgi:hypothetical protein
MVVDRLGKDLNMDAIKYGSHPQNQQQIEQRQPNSLFEAIAVDKRSRKDIAPDGKCTVSEINGNIETVTIYTSEDEKTIYSRYILDRNKATRTTESYDENGRRRTEMICAWDGHALQFNEYDPKTKALVAKDVYEYDKDGSYGSEQNPARIKHYDETNKHVYTETFEYDSRGRVTKTERIAL